MAYHFELKQPAPQDKPRPRLLIYGDAGIGKTTFGATATNAVLMPTEDGALGVNVMRLPHDHKVETWDELIEGIRFLATAEHDRKWFVLDTLNGAEELCREMVCQRDFDGLWQTSKGREGFNAFGKGDLAVAQEFKRLLTGLDYLQQKRGMGIILLAHTGLQKAANALGQDFHKFGAALNKHTWAKVLAWADQVGHASFDLRTYSRDGEKTKAEKIAPHRWLWFGGDAGRDAKSRAGYEMPERIKFSWDDYAQANQAQSANTKRPQGAEEGKAA